MKKKLVAFTLVELIVVVTILSILGTIGFVSLQSYTVIARDSVRISDTKTFIKALNIYQTKQGELPLPDDMTTVSGSGVVFSYQGTLSGSVVNTLKQGQVPLDPLLAEPYLYSTNAARTRAQILSFHEKNSGVANSIVPDIFAQDEKSYQDMYPRLVGDEIGFVLSENSEPILNQELSLVDNETRYQYLINSSEKYEDTGSSLLAKNPISSCMRILESGESYGSGQYTINPTGTQNIEVFCDMEKDGGGWTMVFIAKGARLNGGDIHPLGYLKKYHYHDIYKHVENVNNLVVLSGGIDQFSLQTSHNMLTSEDPGTQMMQYTLIEDWPYYDDIIWERWLPKFEQRQEFAGPGSAWHNIYKISAESGEKTNMNFLSNKRYQGQGWDFTFRSNLDAYPDRVVGSHILAPSGLKFYSDRCQGCNSHSLMNPGTGGDGFFLEHTYNAWRLYHNKYASIYPFDKETGSWDEYEALSDGDVMPGWAMYIR